MNIHWRQRVLIILAALGAGMFLCACGAWDYRFAIDDKYSVVRCNSYEQDVLANNSPLTIVHNGSWTGQIDAIGWNDELIVVRKHPARDSATANTGPAESVWFVINRKTHVPYGPLHAAEYARDAVRLGADRVKLHDLLTARLYSMASDPFQDKWLFYMFQMFIMQNAVWLVLGMPLAVMPFVVACIQALRGKKMKWWLRTGAALWLLPATIYTVCLLGIGFWQLFVF